MKNINIIYYMNKKKPQAYLFEFPIGKKNNNKKMI